MPEVGVIEMADRVHENNWTANLSSPLTLTNTGIQGEHLIDDNNITVFPNPVRGEITISFNSKYTSGAALTLYDVVGRKVNDLWNGKTAEGTNAISINTSEIAKRVYYIKLVIRDSTFVKKIVKQ